jgi:tetratricopeptide (TPR) repeat protein
VKNILGNYKEALEDLNRAHTLQPMNAAILQQRGATQIHLVQPRYALADLESADKLKPDDVFTLSRRGAAKAMLSKFEPALEDLERADFLERDNPYTLTARGVVKLRLGLLPATLADVEAAVAASRVRSDGWEAAALAARGLVKIAHGDVADVLAVMTATRPSGEYGRGHVELCRELLLKLAATPQRESPCLASQPGQVIASVMTDVATKGD